MLFFQLMQILIYFLKHALCNTVLFSIMSHLFFNHDTCTCHLCVKNSKRITHLTYVISLPLLLTLTLNHNHVSLPLLASALPHVQTKWEEYKCILIILTSCTARGGVWSVLQEKGVWRRRSSRAFSHSRLYWISQCMVNQPFVTDTAYQWLL